MPTALLATLLAALLAACSSSSGVRSTSARPAPAGSAKPRPPAARTVPRPPAAAIVRPPVRQPPPPARRQILPGLEGVIGASRDQLVGQFGPARLDVYEGDVRKLQFSGDACVLDVFLYPPAPGREPQATYVEARRASDAQDVDDVACVNALRKRP